MIDQAYISRSVSMFREGFLSRYGLTEYRNRKKPVVIFGMYRDRDYNVFARHKNKIVVVWRGGDGRGLNNRKVKILKSRNAKHYVISKFLSDDLLKWDIKHELLPISSTPLDIQNYPRGNKAYCYYGNEKKKEFYGYSIAMEVEKRTGVKVVFAGSKSHSKKKLMDIYKGCFLALRLTGHDGLPNTVMEMGLMGRKSIYNGGTPHSIPWTNIDDICESVLNEYKGRADPNQYISDDIRKYLDVGNDWLKI